MQRMLPGLALLMIVQLLAGCTNGGHASGVLPSEVSLGAEPAPVNQTQGVARPTWTVGQWWSVTLKVDMGYGFLEQFDGKLVVARGDSHGYRILSDAENLSVFDQYFDQFGVGDFDLDLAANVANHTERLYAWPLIAGTAWTTDFPVPLPDASAARAFNATLKVSALDPDSPDAAHRLRVQGATQHGEDVDYDYSTRTGFMTYFRLTNHTTGRIVWSLDVHEAGLGFHGTLHQLAMTRLFEAFAVTPPCDEQMHCDPAYAATPPTTVHVPTGISWVEEVVVHFTFNIEMVNIQVPGASTSVATFTHPDGSATVSRHVGASPPSSGEFERLIVRGNIGGTWTVSLETAGTGGVFAGVYGIRDDPVTA